MHPYLLSRGIDGSYAAKFHLKYASFGSHVYVNDLGETKSQRFQERIIIPVYDLAGGLVTFQGRDVTGFGERYLFAGGLPGTGRYLYNGHVCAARRSKEAVMGEGAFDVIKTQIALDQYADTQHVTAIGSWGKHLSNFRDGEDQIQALQRLKRHGLEEVVLMWDGEPKAYEAALDAAADILKIGLNVRVAILPAGKDPGELDARVIADAYRNALPATRLSLLRMRMKNPYAPA
jgi:DNA primase